MGKQLEHKERIVLVVDTSKTPKTDTVIQGSIGRMCGYPKSGAHTNFRYIVNTKTVDPLLKELDVYVSGMSQLGLPKLARITNGMNLNRGGNRTTFKNVIPIPINVPISNDIPDMPILPVLKDNARIAADELRLTLADDDDQDQDKMHLNQLLDAKTPFEFHDGSKPTYRMAFDKCKLCCSTGKRFDNAGSGGGFGSHGGGVIQIWHPGKDEVIQQLTKQPTIRCYVVYKSNQRATLPTSKTDDKSVYRAHNC